MISRTSSVSKQTTASTSPAAKASVRRRTSSRSAGDPGAGGGSRPAVPAERRASVTAQLAALLEARMRLVEHPVQRHVAPEDRQLGHGAGLDLVVDMVWGTMWYRVLSGHNPVEPALADEITGAVVRLLGRVRE